jgi:Mg-chelatase subunit ChlI
VASTGINFLYKDLYRRVAMDRFLQLSNMRKTITKTKTKKQNKHKTSTKQNKKQKQEKTHTKKNKNKTNKKKNKQKTFWFQSIALGNWTFFFN